MRLNRVTAQAFGPFRGEKLELAPGLTVVWGLNEAGKSSWHSALQLTITGFRRGRGRPTKDEQVVIDRRRPWSGDQWRLEGELSLDNNELLIVTWDLNSKVAKVLDALGRDRSNEWMSEGACDLSRIVGLDRNSFLATACVRQSDLLGVRDNPALLQDLLQRAATSASADSTASSAIARIDEFLQDHVGLNRSNSSKPLANANRQLEVARQALLQAQEAHRERLGLLQTISTDREAVTSLQRQSEALDVAIRLVAARSVQSDRQNDQEAIDGLRAELAAAVAEANLHRQVVEVAEATLHVVDMRRIHDEARAHHASVEELTEALSSMDVEIRGHDVQERLLLAARRYAERALDLEHLETAANDADTSRQAATSAMEAKDALGRRIAWLNLEVAERSARDSAERFKRASVLHERYPTAPSNAYAEDGLAQRVHTLLDRWENQPVVPSLAGATAAELQAQLDSLPDHPVGDLVPSDEVLQAERDWRLASELLRQHGQARPPDDHVVGVDATPADLRNWAILLDSPREDPVTVEAELQSLRATPTHGATLRVAAALAVALVGGLLGVVVHPGLFVLVVAGVVAAVLANRSSKANSTDLEKIASTENRLAQARSRAQSVDDAIVELHQRGLPGEAHKVRELANQVEMAQHGLANLERWSDKEESLRVELDRTARQLQRCLLDRGVEVDGGAEAMATYRQQCADRSELAVRSRQRSSLAAKLQHRRTEEERAERASRSRHDLEVETAAVASAVGVEPHQPVDGLLDAIRDWLTTRSQRQQMLQTAGQEWSELNHLLGGLSLEALEAAALHDEEFRQRCAERVSDAAASVDDLSELEGRELEELERQLHEELIEVTHTASLLASAVPADDPRLALREAVAQTTEALEHLRQEAGGHANEYEALSVDEIDDRLLSCRDARLRFQQARGDALARAHVLDESSPDLAQCGRDLARAEHALAECCHHRLEAAVSVPPNASRDELQSLHVDHQSALSRAEVKVGKLRGGLGEREQALTSSATPEVDVDTLEKEFDALEPIPLLGYDAGALPALAVLQHRLTEIVEERDRSRAVVARLEGQLGEREENAADPATAAEAHASAHLELQRVQALGEVLATTRSLLEGAQERVHRDIAPRLNETTNRWLPSLFGDRYTTVLIDPASLDVQVFSAGDPRRADLLSQGTAEQFYLLLRVALAETLTEASGESCPLILDDITVNFDRERKAAALELLQTLATERQVILFTQEDEVRTWAERSMGSEDRLICLADRATV